MSQAASSPMSHVTHPGWRVAVPALALVLLAMLVLFRDTALRMLSIWWRNDTYAHGMLVPVMTLWLIWRVRSSIVVLEPRASYLAVLLLAGAGFVWLLGQLAAVNALAQFALTAMLVFAVWAVIGTQVARRIAFPLLFLFFAVPFGDFTQPKLMEWTAQFTVLALRLTGIPVFSEGQQIVIPSGRWSVVEACSGVRYLIASVTIGTLFAYLTYQSWKRRLIFIGVSILVPIVANWLRAYMIVMLGHLSGNKLAVGVDHLIYGWVFFGIVILAMFWIGARWREDVPPAAAVPLSASVRTAAAHSSSWPAAVASVLVAALWPLAQWQVAQASAPPLRQLLPLGEISGWRAAEWSASGARDWQPRFENPAASTQAAFAQDGRVVGLYLAYYRNQDQQSKLVSSTNVLVTSDDPHWARVSGGMRDISFNQQALKVRTAQLRASSASVGLVVWQWYWVNGRWTSSDVLAKAYTALSQLTGKGDDSAVIIVYTPQDQAGQAAAALDDFARAAGPALETVLRQALETR